MKDELEIIKHWEYNSHVPFLSILCITYNHQCYIHDAINSFLDQETSFPFEIIIHNDASTDNTEEILKKYREKYPNLVRFYSRSENQYSKIGFSFINDLSVLCRGKYIAFCEGDDYWIDNKKLQKQIDFLEKNNEYSMSIHNAYIYNCEDKNKRFFNQKSIPCKIRIKDILLRKWFAPTASFLLRKEYLEVSKSKNINGDISILLNAALNGYIYYIDEPMSIYRYLSNQSLSLKSKNSKEKLYQKKYEFIRYVDKKTSYKYIIFTLPMRIKILIAITINKFRKR